MGNLKKHYIGSISTEQKAAKIYDRHAILTHGLRAKTNFSYTKDQILKILTREKDDLIYEESSNISDQVELDKDAKALLICDKLNVEYAN